MDCRFILINLKNNLIIIFKKNFEMHYHTEIDL